MNAPNRSAAVLAQRAPIAVDGGEGGDPNDYFPTPPWAARAGGEVVHLLDPFARRRSCWEPACGEGHMAHGLTDYFGGVACSDLIDRGAGEVLDFLSPEAGARSADWVMSNPPFIDGEAFVRLALARARVGVAMLVRLQFLEGGGRYQLFAEEHPPTQVAVFSERVSMVKGRWDPLANRPTAYAWFIWVHGQAPRPLHWIAPGTKARLTMRSDFERFAPEHLSLAGDLFDEFQP